MRHELSTDSKSGPPVDFEAKKIKVVPMSLRRSLIRAFGVTEIALLSESKTDHQHL